LDNNEKLDTSSFEVPQLYDPGRRLCVAFSERGSIAVFCIDTHRLLVFDQNDRRFGERLTHRDVGPVRSIHFERNETIVGRTGTSDWDLSLGTKLRDIALPDNWISMWQGRDYLAFSQNRQESVFLRLADGKTRTLPINLATSSFVVSPYGFQ